MSAAARSAAFLVAAALSSGAAAASLSSAGFEGARWIWHPAPNANHLAMPAGACLFRASVTIPEESLVESAELSITADNLFVFYVNGTPAGEGPTDPNHWSQPRRFDVSGLLGPARNLIAIEAVNTRSEEHTSELQAPNTIY